MKILNPTDLELDAAFAAEVAGYRIMLGRYVHRDAPPEYNVLAAPFVPPRFTQSADLVLPWLEKLSLLAEIVRGKGLHVHGWRIGWWVRIANNETNIAASEFGDSLPRAAAIALLRASGIEVEFSHAN